MTLPVLPAHMAHLPLDKHHRPIPAFVEWIDGEPDFRVMRGDHLSDCHRFSLCWVCGKRRGRHVTFVIGPMCAVNRTSAEPPCHLECAVYSAIACPFLSVPNMVRRERGLPEDRTHAGMMIQRNPGVTLLWTTKKYRAFRAPGGVLFDIGEPANVRWYTQGREATRAEVLHSIETGLPALQEIAALERGGPEDLARRVDDAMTLLPA